MDNKAELRLYGRALRKSIGLSERSKKSEIICAKLLEIIERMAAKNILAYLAAGSELCLTGLIESLENCKDKYNVAFPGAMGNGEMKALKPFAGSDLELSAYGISAPSEERSVIIKPEELDIILVPLLLFDEEKYRLGQGGGYYDRYLPKAGNALKIGVAFELQRYVKVPREPHDVPMDMLVTEEKIRS